MKSLKHILSFHSLRTNIIFSFSIVSILLVVTTALLSYSFIRKLYLEQLSEQVNLFTTSISLQIEKRYLKTLTFGKLSGTSLDYFQEILTRNVFDNSIQESFIFDHNFILIAHSDETKILGEQDHRLMLNKSEIDALDVRSTTSSLPFKGNDNQWYMWGFVRLTDNHWLAIRESASRLQRVEEFSRYFWLIGIFSVAVTILISIQIARRIALPVEKLVAFSKSIGCGDYDTDEPSNIKGDLKILSDALNAMRKGVIKHHKEKEEILAKIAHEIRNPLGGIELLASLTKEDLEKDKKNAVYVEKILQEVSGLKDLITAYLQYSKPLKANPCWCDVNSITNDVLNLFIQRTSEKKCNVVVENLTQKVWFDQSHLRNVMANLVSNSLDTLPSGGQIKISSSQQNGFINISVNDSGNGIDLKNQSDIFEPFFTTKSSGTGLGLAISKKYCEENNAYLILEKTGSNGTTFTIKVNHSNE